jgi:cell division protein FtsB
MMTMLIILIVAGIGLVAAFITNIALANHRRARQDSAQARKLNASSMYKNGEE